MTGLEKQPGKQAEGLQISLTELLLELHYNLKNHHCET